ncbi:hypothetical protein NG799_01670 [Laspinema sp. D1]|uniref:Uncharacterized protein n=2 Tax=Laspinemataceae TaxID=2815311 RepID=A0ABT2MJX3_9CYAN|nr:hypothetical protein [Laspinema sp. D2a]
MIMLYLRQWVEFCGIPYPEYGYEPDIPDDEIDEAELIQESDEPELIDADSAQFPNQFPDEF